MKYLRHIGLVSSLVIGGVLGGLIAPFPSEAGTATLQLQVDADTYTSSSNIAITLTPDTCSPTESTQGYTACYRINKDKTTDPATAPQYSGTGPAGKRRPFQILGIVNGDGTVTKPSLLVGDGTGLDLFKLGGLRIVPYLGTEATPAAGTSGPCKLDGSGKGGTSPTTYCGWGTAANPKGANTNEKHVLTFTMNNKFDAAFTAAGTYTFGLRSAGFFEAGPKSDLGSPTYCIKTVDIVCDPISDSVVYTGKGIFDTATDTVAAPRNILSVAPCYTPGTNTVVTCPPVNTTNLVFTVGGPASSPSLSFGVPQPDPPALNQVVPYPVMPCSDHAASGGAKCKPDVTLTMVVTMYGPDTMYLSNCTEGAGTPGKNNKQFKDLNEHFTTFKTLDNKDIKGRGAVEATDCVQGQCACTYQSYCNGKLLITLKATPIGDGVNKNFDFITDGLEIYDFDIQTGDTAEGSYLFSPIGTGSNEQYADRIIYVPTSPDYGTIQTDSPTCASANDPLNSSLYYTVIGESDKTALVVHNVANGDTLTCNFHVHH